VRGRLEWTCSTRSGLEDIAPVGKRLEAVDLPDDEDNSRSTRLCALRSTKALNDAMDRQCSMGILQE